MNANQKENVLIVDDVIANLVILTDIIKKAGYVARPVTDVHQAMERPAVVVITVKGNVQEEVLKEVLKAVKCRDTDKCLN